MRIVSQPADGAALDATETKYPTGLQVVANRRTALRLAQRSTAYGYVLEGKLTLTGPYGRFEVLAGGYFCIPTGEDIGAHELNAQGTVVLIQRLGFRGQFVAGSIEDRGRLTYIDGCSDTVLVYPPRMGDPCLNHLHFPAGVIQRIHFHPSFRAGIVARGRGTAYGRLTGERHDWQEELDKGSVFLIDAQELHAFRTDLSREPMDIIAFHPDSDWGPTDQAHPMINRTLFEDG